MLKRIRALLGGKRKPPAETQSPADPARRAPTIHVGPKVVHWPIAPSDLDPDAVKIVRRLTRFDHKAYLVGGCVRDLLLDRKPKDFDVGTSATPRQIKRLFRNCRIIGRRFRLAHIYFQNGKIIEVATFRAHDEQEPEQEEQDRQDLLIRDDNVFGSPEEDALRRDFTINSLFYDLVDDTVLDHTDGLGDLRRKLVRTIGDPEIRFREDPIRILRAIKFAARLGFEIESDTAKALRKTRDELHKAAAPRVLEEINRFCRGGAAGRSVELMGETDVFGVVFPELSSRQAAWELVLHLLGRMDAERAGQRREIRTGEIFAVLLLPSLATPFGWKEDGTVTRKRGMNVRTTIDELLKPIGLRLRVPRREQEYCRQILTSLYRMVPAVRIRRNTKRAILKRECLADALWILRGLADRLGGDFSAARDYWKADTPRDGAAAVARPTRAPTDGRGRRRGRQRAQAAPKRGGPKKTAETRRDLPPPWDDRYFFAALPSAPESAEEERGSATPPPAGGPTEPAPESRPARRKRRPRRRRRGSGSSKRAAAGATDRDAGPPRQDPQDPRDRKKDEE